MKKLIAGVLAVATAFTVAACGAQTTTTTTSTVTGGADAITLWTYPIGGWGDEAQVKELTDAFTEETGIGVKVEYLTYQDGDDKVNTALTAGQGPDLIMEGPERLVANWGASGYMVDLKDIVDDYDKEEIYEPVLSACTAATGEVYEYPLVMTAHCMAINYDAFVEAGADKYVNLETRTWTTKDFKAAVDALYKKFGTTVGAVYCNGQGGDQGTRAIVNNMYNGSFTSDDHEDYVWGQEENIMALQDLYDMEGIDFDASIVGGDEIALLYNETLKLAFCWNIAQQLNPNSADTGEGKTINGQRIEFMSFPSEDENGVPELCGGIWGFGIFDNKDEARIEAAKLFIQFMCDSEYTPEAVKAANYFAVRDSIHGVDITDIWADNETMAEYSKLMAYLGDYYQVAPGWAEARTAWWNLLQEVGKGGDIKAIVEKYEKEADDALKAALAE